MAWLKKDLVSKNKTETNRQNAQQFDSKLQYWDTVTNICSSRYAPSPLNTIFTDHVNLWRPGRSGAEDNLFEEQIKKVQTVEQCSEELAKAFAWRSSKEKRYEMHKNSAQQF